ncbi:hypothetical protein OEZ85_011475 [Tetradesmus obliquus]|uniref:Deacetylase sirtuin-type domain-containing protein n=1 Tax=Tetradesmus obliquus TaxID=3088 RepID=A0ABY8TQG4_TETOB|nr:hypothetical protein OEZ85_011475 [Tetradesmus obliquus]
MTRRAVGSSEPAWPASACTSVLQGMQDSSKRSSATDDSACDAAAAQLQQLCLEAACSKVPRSLQQQQQQPSLLSSCDLAGIAHYIASGRARNIVVMAGAGLSVSAGIPDFRTPGTGLYSQLQRFQLPWPEAVFDIRFFRHNPKPFYLLAKELFPGGYCPTPAHFFLKLLHDKGLLLSAFTQNIDGLEQLAGLPADKVVPAHGSFDGAHCIDCGRACSVYAVQQAVYDDEVATCDSCGGLVKPDIVFFGEPLPARFHRRRLADLAQADLLIVMGTSLVVQPFASMIDAVPADCPRLLINMNKGSEQSTGLSGFVLDVASPADAS